MPGMEMLLSGGVDLELAGELIIILPRFVMTRNRGQPWNSTSNGADSENSLLPIRYTLL